MQYARRTRADEDTDTRGSISFPGRSDGLSKSVLLHGELCEPIVPAIKVFKVRPDAHAIEAGHFTNICLQGHGLEPAGSEAAETGLQRPYQRVAPCS